MSNNKNIQFTNNINYFRCPKCKSNMIIENNSLKCENNHCFDISKKGYINFLINRKPPEGYDKTFFEKRREMLNDGFYEHIAKEITNILDNCTDVKNIVDAGCGDGYYSHIIEDKNHNIFAFDFSKDAINVASRGVNNICFMVSDINDIPLKDKSMDCILNIYTPANYIEFKRILSDSGKIIKVVPGKEHLKELRHIIKEQLKNEEYSNQEVIDCFKEHCELINRVRAKNTIRVNSKQLENLIRMTPLMFDIDLENINYNDISEITIDGEILVGKIK
ncbi:methyltransferase domain-containing protein [Anaerofustis stercorihominis]